MNINCWYLDADGKTWCRAVLVAIVANGPKGVVLAVLIEGDAMKGKMFTVPVETVAIGGRSPDWKPSE